MKIILRTISLLTVMSALIVLTDCSKSDPAPAATSQADKTNAVLTSGTWKIQTVTVDGTDQSSIYKGLVLNFTATAFTSINGGAVWPASGTWAFTDNTGQTIKRDDGLPVTITSADNNKLVLTLTWSKTTLGEFHLFPETMYLRLGSCRI